MAQRSNDPYAQAADWLSSAARGKPEALLLVAAGCALLLRRGKSAPSRKAVEDERKTPGRQSKRSSDYYAEASRAAKGRSGQVADAAASAVGRAAAGVGDLAEDLSTKAASASAAVGDYVSDASGRLSAMAQDYSQDVTRHVQTVGEMVKERPLLVAVAGLAAGAALAAMAPMTGAENRAFRDVRTRVGAAASDLTENMKGAASQAKANLKKEVQENGLSSDGVKDVLRDAAETFVKSATGSAEKASSKKEKSS